MVDSILVRQLLKQLEAERRSPVQLRVDTPGSLSSSVGEYFGDFEQRPLTVTPVKDLDRRRYDDSMQFSGEYTSLAELREKVNKFNSEKIDQYPLAPKYQLLAEGIFAEPIQKGWAFEYRTKVADITLKLIE